MSELTHAPESVGSGWTTSGRWAIAFAAAFLLYSLTASDEVQWQDSGEFVLRVASHQLNSIYGTARAHPLHYWLCRAFAASLPLKPPHSMALVSSWGGAVAVANVFAMVGLLTRRTGAATLAAAGLMVAHSFWRFSCYVEVYSLTAACLTAELWALFLWDLTREPLWIVLIFLANGVGLANHDMALLSLPVSGTILLIALYRRDAGWTTALLGIVAWVVGASPFLGLVAYDAAHTSLGEAVRSALFGKWSPDVLGYKLPMVYFATSLAFTALSFPNLMLPAAVLGLFRGRRLGVAPISFFSLVAVTAFHVVFVLRYNVVDQYTFLEPAYALIAVLSGLGFALIMNNWSPSGRRWVIGASAASVLLTPLLYVSAAMVTRHFHLLGRFARNKPFRDDYRYLFLPWGRGENSAERMSRQALELAGGDGLIIFQDDMASFAVQYHLLIEHRPGVRCLSKSDAGEIAMYAAAHRPVVFIAASPQVPPPPPPVGDWKRVGEMFVLEAPVAAGAAPPTTSQ